jgi:cyclase
VIRLLVGVLLASGLVALDAWQSQPPASQVGRVQKLAPDVYFHEGDIGKVHCNNAWVVFDDYVLVIDANYPSGAREVLPKIRETTSKPIRFAFDTHHHGDHAYGNQVWAEQGATLVAHTGVLEELKKYETGHYGGAPGRWEGDARQRADVRESRLKPPSVLFPDMLIFDDGTHRVELQHLGVGHTHGDGFAWLPREKILFTGDAAVNGPYNFVGDGDTGRWIATLERAHALGALIVGPGHGPLGTGAVVADQRQFFVELRRVVTAASAGRSADQVQASIASMRAELAKNASIARYVGDPFPAQVAKVYRELTGGALPDGRAEDQARQQHQGWHGHPHVHPHPAVAGEAR